MHLAQALEVSRTPLREALTRLVGEQFLEARPRRGFYVRELRADEFDQLYQIRANLDPWALELAGVPPAHAIEELRVLNHAIRSAAGNTLQVIELDDRWHLALLDACRNKILLDLIEQMMWRTRRYEYAYLSSGKNVAVAGDQHEQILDCLADGDLTGAIDALRTNMTTAIEPLLEWIDRLPRGPNE